MFFFSILGMNSLELLLHLTKHRVWEGLGWWKIQLSATGQNGVKQTCVTLTTPQHLFAPPCFDAIIQTGAPSKWARSITSPFTTLEYQKTVTNKAVVEHAGSGCSKFYKIRPQILWGESSNKRLMMGQWSLRGPTTIMTQAFCLLLSLLSSLLWRIRSAALFLMCISFWGLFVQGVRFIRPNRGVVFSGVCFSSVMFCVVTIKVL